MKTIMQNKKFVDTLMAHCAEHDCHFNDTMWQCGECHKELLVKFKRAEEDLRGYRDAWFGQRTATGREAWTVPNPFILRSVETSPFFQQQYRRFIEFADRLMAEKKPIIGEFEKDPFPEEEKDFARLFAEGMQELGLIVHPILIPLNEEDK
jgi:hypothetical protein